MDTLSNPVRVTLMQLKYNAYNSITLTKWQLNRFTINNNVKLLDFDVNAVSNKLTVNDITVTTNSLIRESTIFDFKGTVKTSLTFDYLKLFSSQFNGENGQSSSVFINLAGTSNTLTSMQHWDINSVTFDREFTLVKYSSGKTTPTFTISDITFRGGSNIKYAKMFLIEGDVSTDGFILDNFKITDSTIGDQASKDKSVFIELSGKFKATQLTNFNILSKSKCNY